MSYLAPTRSGATTASEKRRRNGFFSTVKNIFTNKDKKGSQRTRRLSILSTGSNSVDLEAEKAMQKRRENCLAIRTAKTEPIEVQRLLIDCEFCNPQKSYGRNVEINTPQFMSSDVLPPAKVRELAEVEPETEWNVGLHEWLEIRKWWNAPSPYSVPPHHSLEGVSADKYFVIYDKFVRRTRVPKEPINLDDTVKLLKAGWVGEGAWPSQTDPEDVWSDEEVMVTPEEATGSADERVVKFSNAPHPKCKDQNGLKTIERTMSTNSDRCNLDLVPTRSAASSLISITDSE